MIWSPLGCALAFDYDGTGCQPGTSKFAVMTVDRNPPRDTNGSPAFVVKVERGPAD